MRPWINRPLMSDRPNSACLMLVQGMCLACQNASPLKASLWSSQPQKSGRDGKMARSCWRQTLTLNIISRGIWTQIPKADCSQGLWSITPIYMTSDVEICSFWARNKAQIGSSLVLLRQVCLVRQILMTGSATLFLRLLWMKWHLM